MATQGPNSPGTVSTDFIPGNTDWTNPSRITSSNDSRATCATSSNAYQLNISSFGFSIPSGATIDGILLEVEGYSTDALNGWQIYLTKDVATADGITSVKSALTGTSEAYVSFGGSADVWGGSWADTDINGSGFGAYLYSDRLASGSQTFSIDHVRITVYYTGGAVAATGNFFQFMG